MKTQRAGTHLEELTKVLGEFEKNPYDIKQRDHSKKQRHIVSLEFRAIPYEIGMLAGEFAYSLRSGLDQLAWQLALIKTRPKQPRSHTSFPVWSISPPKGFGNATRDILPAAISVIESLQPYKSGTARTRHPLYMLNELCIIDKHMIMPVRASDGKFHIGGAVPLRRRETSYGFELEYDLRDKFKIDLSTVKTEIIFGQPVGSPGNKIDMRLADFKAIYEFVRTDVIPKFLPFFK